MIHFLTHQNRDRVSSYLDQDPLHNIYLIHALQNCGLKSEHVTFWGTSNGDQLEGVLFADNDYTHRFGSLAGDNAKVLARLGKFALKSGIRILAGKDTSIQPIVENLPAQFLITHVEHLKFYHVYPEKFRGRHGYPVQRATRDDIPLLVELYKNYELGGRKPPEEIEREIHKAMDKKGNYFFLKSQGRAVSAARIFPQTDRVGMIDGATTLPEYRGRGMYACVRTACLEHLFEQKKIGVGLVNQNNATVQRVVNKQGGSFIAQWLIVRFNKRPPLRRRILAPRLRRWALNVRDTILNH